VWWGGGNTHSPTSLPQPTVVVVATTRPQPTAGLPKPTTAAAATQAPAGATDTTAAVQVVLDYYDAIGQKQYDAAYDLWARVVLSGLRRL